MGLAILAGVILLFSLIGFRRYLPYVGSSFLPKEPPPVVVTMENMRLVGMGKKGKLWSMRARRVEVARDRTLTTLSGISDGRIYDSGKVALKVDAGRAVYDSSRENMQLSGGIDIRGRNGERVTAEGADWNSSTSTLRSKGRIRVETRWSTMTADNLIVDVAGKELTMRNVSGTANVGRLDAADER